MKGTTVTTTEPSGHEGSDERMVGEALTIALPQLDPAARDAAIRAVLRLLVSTDDEDRGARFSMITLLATPCRYCADPVLWVPMLQGWTHYHGAERCQDDNHAHHASPVPAGPSA